MKKIFEKIHLNHLTLKNRLVRSATWEGIAALDGSIDERTYKIYEELVASGQLSQALPAFQTMIFTLTA